MLRITSLLVLLVAGSSMSAPTSGGNTVTIKNQCSTAIQVNQLTNGESSAGQATYLDAGSQRDYSVASGWGGRFWGRKECTSGDSDCLPGDPASLAEFLFNGDGGKDFYDVSFVDGFNLPITITPVNAQSSSSGECGSPSCTTLPSCSADATVKDSNGNVVGCKSACAQTGSDADCCLGSYSSADTCGKNQYAQTVKAACPDVYSFPYDDQTSTFVCTASHFEVTFC